MSHIRMHYGKRTKCQDCIKQCVQLSAVKNDVRVGYLGVNVGKTDVHDSRLHNQGMHTLVTDLTV